MMMVTAEYGRTGKKYTRPPQHYHGTMPPGPILIFDKSFLQSLNSDEAVWLDNFFLTGITPLFFVETLADLEREVNRGRTPEQVVGNLAIESKSERQSED